MRAFLHSSRAFWSVSLIAAALVLLMSVELGKVVGATILANGASAKHTAPIVAAVKGTPGVVGGQRHAAGAP